MAEANLGLGLSILTVSIPRTGPTLPATVLLLLLTASIGAHSVIPYPLRVEIPIASKKSIISELKKTDKGEVAEKFAELAKEQSMDEGTKENGGSLGFINKDTLSSEYDELVTAAYNLKDGKFSTKVITTELGYHVVLRTETKEKASLEDVKEDIVSDLAADYL